MLTRILKGLLIAAIFSSIMAAQPLVTIQPARADIAVTGVKLLPIDAPEHAAVLNAILGDEANLIAPLLPNSVLVVNGSSKKLRGIGVLFKWSNPKSPKGTTVVMTSLDKGDDPTQLKPGEVQLFTPAQVANIFFSGPAAKRQKPVSGNAVTSSATTDFNNLLQQGINELSGLSGVQAVIESLIFEDYSYLGPDSTLTMLQRTTLKFTDEPAAKGEPQGPDLMLAMPRGDVCEWAILGERE